MASCYNDKLNMFVHKSLLILLIISTLCRCDASVLQVGFYDNTCPNLQDIVFNGVQHAINQETRMAASIVRLFFHDCFVQGCDASNLLDDSPTIVSEKNAGPNFNSARGFNVIDDIKANVESACPKVVSCADILALAARDSIALSGGPRWDVPLGRRDSRTASFDGANQDLPSPFFNLESLLTSFKNNGLSLQDLITLSGAHTFGFGQCQFFRVRLYNTSGDGKPDASLNQLYLKRLRDQCPSQVGDNNLVSLDPYTPTIFDNRYYSNLMIGRGLFISDQALFSTSPSDSSSGSDAAALVQSYAQNPKLFLSNFVASMIKLGNISPITDPSVSDIRTNCRVTNAI